MPYWTYIFVYAIDTNVGSSCHSINYYSDYVYGMCAIKTDIFNGVSSVIHVVKANHNSGEI